MLKLQPSSMIFRRSKAITDHTSIEFGCGVHRKITGQTIVMGNAFEFDL